MAMVNLTDSVFLSTTLAMQDAIQSDVNAWKSQLKKGTLELAVLLLLKNERRYGLQLVEVLNELQLEISEGSIYPLLSRLRAEKKVETEWVDDGVGHAHKFYRLTDTGKKILKGMLTEWRRYGKAFDELIGAHE
jgi:PadR family transcriptional regulator PadR